MSETKIDKKEIRKPEQKFARGKNPNSRKNLKPAKPGEVRNPAGKPVGTLDIKTRLIKMLEANAPDSAQNTTAVAEFCKDAKSVTNFDAVNARLLYNAIIEGELSAIKEVFDRTEGRASQAVDMNHSGEVELNHQVKLVDDLLKNYGSDDADTNRD